MKKLLMIVSLMLVLFMITGAMAEQAVSDSAEMPVQIQETETAETSAASEEDGQEASAVSLALAAYRALKGSGRVKNLESLKTELEAYAADGKLTREQADLVLQYYTERFASRGTGRNQEKTNGSMGGNVGRKGHPKGINESQNGTGRKTKTFDGQGRSNMKGNRKGDSLIEEGTSGNENAEPDASTGATTKGSRQRKR